MDASPDDTSGSNLEDDRSQLSACADGDISSAYFDGNSLQKARLCADQPPYSEEGNCTNDPSAFTYAIPDAQTQLDDFGKPYTPQFNMASSTSPVTPHDTDTTANVVDGLANSDSSGMTSDNDARYQKPVMQQRPLGRQQHHERAHFPTLLDEQAFQVYDGEILQDPNSHNHLRSVLTHYPQEAL